MRTLLAVIVLLTIAIAGSADMRYIKFGPGDDRYAVEGWYPYEGPYTQFDSFSAQVFRWGRERVRVSIPVFPGVDNKVGIVAKIANVPDQKMTVSAGGQVLLTTGFVAGDDYVFTVPTDVVGGSESITLDIHVSKAAGGVTGDPRQLYIALATARIEGVSAEQSRPAHDPRTIGVNASPAMWRFCEDPKDSGDNWSKIHQFFYADYDDSGWQLVRAGRWNGIGAAWYRAWLDVCPGKSAPERIELPSGGDGRVVYLNGRVVAVPEGETQEQALAKVLKEGLSCVAVKVARWPHAMRTVGDASGVTWHTEDGRGDTYLVIDSLPQGAAIEVRGQSGRIYKSTSPQLPVEVRLPRLGRYTLSATVDGRTSETPIHFLGIAFFHWGWYGPGGCGMDGPGWNEFQPCSNKFMDQLFERAASDGPKHHALSHDGWIYEDPSTQPLPRRAARGFAAVKSRDYVGETRRLIAEGKLDLVGMPYASRSADEADGEELIRSLRYSRDIYKSQLGCESRYFISHDASIAPQIPQIMRLAGYDTYVVCDNWWGQGSVPNARDCVWRSMDGTSVDVLSGYYHACGVQEIAMRAARDGKPVALSGEEFACLDPTKFFNEADRLALEKTGIVIRPISLDRYRAEIAQWASTCVASKDSDMAYKGWTGGDPAETEYESLNRQAEYKLAAAESIVSLARIMGYELPQKTIDDAWKTCMIYNDCHTHWFSAPKAWRDDLREVRSTAAQIQMDAARFVAGQVKTDGDAVVVVNSLGWKRSGLAEVELSEDLTICDPSGDPVPQQRAGSSVRFWAGGVPSLGVKSFRIAPAAPARPAVRVSTDGNAVELRNPKLRVTVSGRGISVFDPKGRVLCDDARLYVVKPQAARSFEPISTWDRPLNPVHYEPVRFSRVEAGQSGPAEATVAVRGRIPGYSGARVEGTVSLGAGADAVAVDLKLIFNEPAAAGVRQAGSAHEGQYIPGIFFAFPCGDSADIIVDKAYCLGKDTLKCGNRETFLQHPFRFRTTNALSLAAPDSGDFAVLTAGLTDFFQVPWTDGNLIGLSLGSGEGRGGACPFYGSYDYAFSIYAPPAGELWRSYTRAQEEMVPLEAFDVDNPQGSLAPECSLLSASGDAVVTGVQGDGAKLQARVLDLTEKPSKASLRSWFALREASVSPGGETRKPGNVVKLNLPPRALREVTATIDSAR